MLTEPLQLRDINQRRRKGEGWIWSTAILEVHELWCPQKQETSIANYGRRSWQLTFEAAEPHRICGLPQR